METMQKSPKGLFITFEGIEGSGKTTHARKLFEYLKKKGYACIFTQEPGGTPLGEKIRALLLNPESGSIDALAEVLLFEASRREHVIKVVFPAIKKGEIVICVRFNDSTLAYQGYGRKIPLNTINYLNRMVTENLQPDLTFLLDVTPEVGLRRALAHTPQEEMRFEKEFEKKGDLLCEIREGFLNLAKKNPNRIKTIDSHKPKEEVFKEIKKEVENLLDQKVSDLK